MYSWQRFWCPITGSYSLADDGFLADPESSYSFLYKSDAVSYAKIAHKPCLALLGEPGIGKSTAIRSLIAQLTVECAKTGEDSLDIDLSEFGSEDRLERRIVDSLQFKRWSKENGTLHIVLDSLDECRVRIPNIASLLLRIFRDNRSLLPKLHLRIACRTADWPSLLTGGMENLWGSENFAAYELLPLRRQDIIEAARVEGIDEKGFIDAIRAVDAQPLAIKPITLQFLIGLFKSGKGLPKKQTDLYESGCRNLCTETSESRRAAGHLGLLDPDQRLAVASRIAAVMKLCNRTAVAIDPIKGVHSQDIVTLDKVTGGTETAKGNQITVTEAEIREVLTTGLFSGRGTGLLGFAHQTYAEFLAAKYLASHDLDLAQIRSLICHSGDSNRPVIPQLAETVGWLASMNRPLFQYIMDTDPVVLLRSDAATADNSDRAALIEGLLRKLNEVKIDDSDWSIRSRCARFVHPGLSMQLRPYIVDKSKEIIARRVAIDIATDAKLADLLDTLVSVALDRTEAYHTRYQAAHAIAAIGDDAHRQQLSPLLAADDSEDPDDDLRGCAMKALWSKRLIGLDQLLSAIKKPRRESYMGFYSLFLTEELTSQLTLEEIPRVLAWLGNGYTETDDDSCVEFRRISDSLISQTLAHLDNEAIRVALALYLLKRLEHRDGIYSSLADKSEQEAFYENHNQRHKLIGEMIRQMHDVEKQAEFLVYTASPLVRRTDFQWVLEEAVGSTEAEISRGYALLASWVFDIQSVENVERIIDAAGRSNTVQKAFDYYLRPIHIDSPEAQQLRDKYQRHKEITSRPNPPEPLNPPMTEQIKKWLQRYESGEINAWWQLNYCMLFDRFGHAHGRNDLEDDLRELPGWQDADQEIHSRMIKAAKSYLLNGNPDDASWLGTNTLHRPACAGYRALVLLAHEDPDALKALPSGVWAKWAAIILAFPVSVSIVGNEQPALDLVALSYKHAPEATILALLAVIDKENTEENLSNIFILRKMQNCWDGQLCRALVEKAKDANLKPSCVGDLLHELLENGCSEAKALAQSLVTLPAPTDERPRSLAREAAIALIENADDAGWSVVWPACTADREFGQSVLEAIAQRDQRKGNLANRLTENDMAALYIWLTREYPHAEDPNREETHFVGTRESVADFRDSILRSLEVRGTSSAVTSVQKIARELPHLHWLKYTILSARNRMLRQSWVPPQPNEILMLCASRSSWLVRSASELQDVLVEVLNEINQELQGETPSAPELWNLPTSSSDKTSIRPKDENRLSDWLKIRIDAKLKGRGIISLREVEIRRGEGTGDTKSPGERTDLHITGLVPGPIDGTVDTVRVIIEVKGCWHSEIQTAMETQLVNRYLADNTCQHGIYVVGWYQCFQWDENDKRKVATPKWTIKEATHKFDQQAEKLSAVPYRIRAVVLNTALR